jgi:adenylate kinase family enzyme
MRKVILTAGPQASGKTTVCKKIIENRKDIFYIERDAILREMFGRVYLFPSDIGKYKKCLVEMWRRISRVLLKNDDVTLILDTWNQTAHDRCAIVNQLLALNADEIILWYFTTNEDICTRQYIERDVGFLDPDEHSYVEKQYRENYRLYHQEAIELYPRRPKFNSVVRIDGAQRTLFSYHEILI